VKSRRGERSSYEEGVGFGALGFMAAAFIGVFSSIVIARLYGVRVIGEYALVIAPASITWFVSSAREQPALVRELALHEPRSSHVTGLTAAVMTFSVGLTIVVAIPAMIATYFLYAGPIGTPELFLPALLSMAGYVVLTNTCWNMDMVFAAFRAGRVLFWLRLHQIVAYFAFALGLSFVDSSVWGITVATVMSWGTVTVHRGFVLGGYMRWWVPRAEIRAGFKTLPKMLRFGLKIVPGTVADGISQELPVWILGAFGSVSSVGAFSRAWLLSRRLIELNYRITEMLFPTLVERHATGDREGFDRALVDTLRLATYALLLPAAAAGGAATGVMGLFGPGFERASTALAVVLTVPALSLLSQAQTHALLAVDRPLTSSKISIVRMLVTVTACIVLVRAYGITGAAVAVVLGYVVDLAIRFWITRTVLETRLTVIWPARTMIALAIAYAVGFATAEGFDFEVGGALGTFCGLTAGSLAYCAALWATGGLLPRDRDRLGTVCERVARARKPAPAATSLEGVEVRSAMPEAAVGTDLVADPEEAHHI